MPDRDEPDEGDIVTRQSHVGSMELCPGRVGLAKVEGFISTPSYEMARGSLTHSVIEKFLLTYGHAVLDEWPMEMMMTDTTRRLLEEIATKDEYELSSVSSEERIDEMCNDAITAASDWFEQVWKGEGLENLPLVAIEELVIRPMGTLPDGRAIWLQGTPDAVYQDCIRDWKTSKAGWRVSRSGLTKANFSIQAPLYIWLSEAIVGTLVEEFDYYDYSFADATWTVHPTRWDKRSIESALLSAWEYGKMIAYETYPYTPARSPFGKFERGWFCSPTYCGAWNICPGKARVSDGYNLDQVKDERW